VYIWLQVCQILTDLNNFCSAETRKMYKTEHSLTYILLKESVANDVINVSLFAYDKITLKLKLLTKEDKILIKKCMGIKKYGWDD